MDLMVVLNGQPRTLDGLEHGEQSGVALQRVVEGLGFRSDRIAVELNGEIVRRAAWADARVRAGDRLEVVHFVGGGADAG